jgi:hypothetical protein
MQNREFTISSLARLGRPHPTASRS